MGSILYCRVVELFHLSQVRVFIVVFLWCFIIFHNSLLPYSLFCDAYFVRIKFFNIFTYLLHISGQSFHSSLSITHRKEEKNIWWTAIFNCLFTQSRTKPGNLIFYSTSVYMSCVIFFVCELFLKFFYLRVLFSL